MVSIMHEIVMQSFEILWELYWKQPDILDRMISSLMIPLPEDEQYKQIYGNPALQEPEIQDVIEIFYPNEPSRADRLAWDLMLLRKLAVDIQTLSDFDYSCAARGITEFLTQYNNHTWSSLEDEKYRRTRYHSPSWRSVGEHLRGLFEKSLVDVDTGIREFLGKRYGGAETPPNPLNTSPLSDRLQNNTSVNSVVLFAPSGAGKTYEILQHLSQNFGFYFQACKLPISTGDLGIHGPHRQSGSKDTFSLSQLIDYVNEHVKVHEGFGKSVLFGFVEGCFRHLIDCRFFVFSRFLKGAELLLHSHEEDRLQWLWLLLQTSDEQDIFDSLFQIYSILCLYDPEDVPLKLNPNSVQETVVNLGFSKPLYYCLDEAQADLNFTMTEGTESWSLLNIWANAFMDLFRTRHRSDPHLEQLQGLRISRPDSDISIFSGTSLKLKEAVSTIRDIRTYSLIIEPNNWDVDEVYYLRQVTTVDDFRAIMEQSELAATLSQQCSEVKAKIKAKIIDCARVLFGRPRWSDIYLRNLNKNFSEPWNKDWETKINEIVERTCQNIRQDLTDRLNTLKARESNRKYYDLMDDLCRVAVSQELLDSGYFFMNDEHHILISEGFAYMKPINGSYKQVISETLAVQAAKDYFLVQNPALVENQLNRMIEAQQNDRAALGKTAEWFLAWVSIEGYTTVIRIDRDFRICTGHSKTIKIALSALQTLKDPQRFCLH